MEINHMQFHKSTYSNTKCLCAFSIDSFNCFLFILLILFTGFIY